jgi:hypothetical protein
MKNRMQAITKVAMQKEIEFVNMAALNAIIIYSNYKNGRGNYAVKYMLKVKLA